MDRLYWRRTLAETNPYKEYGMAARTVEQMVKRLRRIESMTRPRPKHAREAYELREALRAKGIDPRMAVKPNRVRRKADGTRIVIPSFRTARWAI